MDGRGLGSQTQSVHGPELIPDLVSVYTPKMRMIEVN